MYRGLRFCSTVIIVIGFLTSAPLFFLGGSSLLAAAATMGNSTGSPEEATVGVIAGGMGAMIAFAFIAAGLFSFALASFAGFGGLALADIAENSRKTATAVRTM